MARGVGAGLARLSGLKDPGELPSGLFGACVFVQPLLGVALDTQYILGEPSQEKELP